MDVLQPMRDLVFFQREIQPFSHWQNVATASPTPTETVILPPDETESHSIKITMDLWLPKSSKAAVAVLFHGSSPRGRHLGLNQMLAKRLQEAGWLVATPDARGFGESGDPDTIQDPAAWQVTQDVRKIFDYVADLQMATKPFVAIGHSLGANHVLEGALNNPSVSALVLIGPSIYTEPLADYPTFWERLRFSSDRKIKEIVPARILRDRRRAGDIILFSKSMLSQSGHKEILLIDGALESAQDHKILQKAAGMIAPPLQYETIPGSGHYCGAYQLPFISHPMFYRSDILERCVTAILGFMKKIGNGSKIVSSPNDIITLNTGINMPN